MEVRVSDDQLKLAEAWVRLRELGDRKPALTIAQANTSKGSYCDFIDKDDHLYRLTSIGRGEAYSVRRL